MSQIYESLLTLQAMIQDLVELATKEERKMQDEDTVEWSDDGLVDVSSDQEPDNYDE